jgi:hypothetical protein
VEGMVCQVSGTLVIKVKWGGLGDHLLHSPLPRLAKVCGFDKVLISNHSDYANPAVKHFLWESSVFVDGFTDEDHDYPQFGSVPDGKNMLDVVKDFYQLPEDGKRFREPEIPYRPKTIPELKEAVVYEPNHKNAYGIPSQEQIERYFAENGIVRTHQLAPIYGQPAIPGISIINAPSLEQLCDVIYSCKAFYCLVSGVATLAAAVGKPTTVLHVDGINPMFLHSKMHMYTRI